MKQRLLFLLLALATLMPESLSAFNYQYEGVTLRYDVIDEEAKTCKVVGYKYFEGALVIPEIANDGTNDYTVTIISMAAFKNCTGLTSVVIGNTVTSIGDQAFGGCTELISLEIGESMSSISKTAFEGCKKLSTLLYNAENLTEEREEYKFPSSLKTLEFGESVRKIPRYVFQGCSGLTSVVIPNSVTTIGNGAFRDCSGLTSVVIGNSVTSIGDYAFESCSGLTSVVIPNSVTSIGNYAFSSCDGLTSVIIGNSVTSIGYYAFYGCSGLTSVVIPNSVTAMGQSAFRGCSGLTSVVIGNSVTEIGSSAFRDCSGLTSVEIPNSVTVIVNQAFVGCSGLTSVEIPNSVTVIGNQAFWGCSGLTSVVIPNSVTSIGSEAFSGCKGLTSVEIPNSVILIGDKVFDKCDNLKTLLFNAEKCNSEDNLKGTLISTSIENVVFGEKVTIIPNNLLKGCEYLKSVALPNSVTSIGNDAFYGCKGLTSVVIPNSVTSIGYEAFKFCSGLTSVVIPNSVTTIGYSAFESCNLDTIVIGYGVKEIGSGAFSECPASNIYITAQTPPTIQSGTFSKYTGKLWLQGKAAVDAYDNDKYWGNFNNEVMTEPTALTINGLTEISGNAGDTFQLDATIMPADVTLPYIMWRSTNPKVAAVDTNGKVTLMAFKNDVQTRAEEGEEEGVCKIIAESLYFDGPIAEVTVYNTGIEVASISLNESELKLKIGESSTLTVTVNNMEDKTVTWISSNEAVATVDAEGNVTAVAVGEAVITATCGELSATCKVTVVPTLAETLTIDPTTWNGEEGSEFTITATVLPEDATDKTLTWTSSDETVATVDSEGNVKVLKEGNCTITVATTDGSNLTAECVITSLSGVDAIFGEDAVVDVYDMNGVLVKKGCERGELQQLLTPGVYVLRSGNATVKAVIR